MENRSANISNSNLAGNFVQGTVQGDVKADVKNVRQQVNQHHSSEKELTLAEAADEIQRLLKQLEETNPSATEVEKVGYVNIATKPDLKQRTVAALKAGGEKAIDEFVLENKYLKIGKAVLKGWLQAK